MKISLFIFLLFAFSITSLSAATPASPKTVTGFAVKDPVIPYSYFRSMKIKEAEKLLGRKMKLKEKLAFKAYQWSLKKGFYPVKPSDQSKKGNTAMILGIVAIVSLFVPFLGVAAIPSAILAIIFGNQAKKINPNDGQAKTGVILGWITIGLIALAILLLASLLIISGYRFN